MKYLWKLPIRTVSECNVCQHWTERKKRKDIQKSFVRRHYEKENPTIKFPCIITLTRIAPRALDDDNLRSSMKTIRDSIADCITPGLAPGRADNRKDIDWMYEQKKGVPHEYAVEIEICGIKEC